MTQNTTRLDLIENENVQLWSAVTKLMTGMVRLQRAVEPSVSENPEHIKHFATSQAALLQVEEKIARAVVRTHERAMKSDPIDFTIPEETSALITRWQHAALALREARRVSSSAETALCNCESDLARKLLGPNPKAGERREILLGSQTLVVSAKAAHVGSCSETGLPQEGVVFKIHLKDD